MDLPMQAIFFFLHHTKCNIAFNNYVHISTDWYRNYSTTELERHGIYCSYFFLPQTAGDFVKVVIHVEIPKAAPQKSICHFQKLEMILK